MAVAKSTLSASKTRATTKRVISQQQKQQQNQQQEQKQQQVQWSALHSQELSKPKPTLKNGLTIAPFCKAGNQKNLQIFHSIYCQRKTLQL